LTHAQCHAFIEEFGRVLHEGLGIGRGHRVALVLPNGPELALSILAVSQWAACVPLSATGAVSELKADLERCGPDLIIGPYSAGPLPAATPMENHQVHEADEERYKLAQTYNVMTGGARDWTVHHHVEEVAKELGIPCCGLVPCPTRAGPFKLVVPKKKTKKDTPAPTIKYDELPLIPSGIKSKKNVDTEANTGNDEALVLFTSGTTGNKKLVPHQIGDLLTAATVIALSWQLQPHDVNCNLMPLFHVGGIVRQVFSPLVSGSTVICCPSFDADLFWALLEKKAFNWYYAAPTMHQIILQTGKSLFEERIKMFRLKMIANAAGGLLPSLAQELKDTFKAAVLPSYGMTECMPISSPPANYDLSKPGTSGVPVGPEVAILNTATVESLPPMEEGPICVRGEPCFRGYGVLANDPKAEKPASFLKDGWFNTGDLGYLDADGYLYITGRSKEVINRGGEIIAPMEVEEAVLSHPDVQACAAFSAAHDVLQETVGIVLVTDPNQPRKLDLATLQSHVAEKLAAPKWPQCIVFMDGGLPKSHTNKLLRVKLGERLGLPELTDDMTTWARTFEAKCPPQGTPLTDPIPSKPVSVDASEVEAILRKEMKTESIWVVPYPNRPGAVVAYVSEKDVDRRSLVDRAVEKLDRYAVPTHVCFVENMTDSSSAAMKNSIPSPKDAVETILNGGDATSDPLVEQIQDMFVELLALDYVPTPDTDFFHIGGSSMRASQLAGKIRKTFNVGCSGAEVFHHSTPATITGIVKARQAEATAGSKSIQGSNNGASNIGRDDQGAPFSGKRLKPECGIFAHLFQLVPMFIIFPAWQIARYLLFFALLLEKSRFFYKFTDRDIVTFLMCYALFHMCWVTIVPLIFVAIKWLVIGRYQAGRYPIWGSYYLRWWFVDVCRKLFLRGIWGSNDLLLNFYYRLLGANIAPGARISLEADVAEFDLVTVGKNAAVELCTLRGFAADNGAMLLGPVRVGDESSVGLRSVVAPYTQVPDGRHLGPVTSTYDTEAFGKQHARVNRRSFPEPSIAIQVLVGSPITFFVNLFGEIPPLIVLYWLLMFKSREDDEHFFSNWNELIDWLCDPARIPFFIGIRLARALLSPFFYMFAAIVVKKLFIGKFEPGPWDTNSSWQKFRYWLAAALFTRKKIQACTDLMGRHYENVSRLYRLLGAKVGKRVFWPGHQLITCGTFELLEIGDDCVFGSRSSLINGTTDRWEKIILCAGANVADNCVVMAGTVVGKNAVLGSNSISPEGTYLPAGSVWFGSNGCTPTCLEQGTGGNEIQYGSLDEEDAANGIPMHASRTPTQLQMVGDDSNIRPFGKAFYVGKAQGNRVWSLTEIVAFTIFNRVGQIIFHLLPILGAIEFGSVLLYTDHPLKDMYRNSIFGSIDGYNYEQAENFNVDKFLWFERDFDNQGHHHTFGQVYLAVFSCFLVTHFIRVVLWLIIEISAKWFYMGRRQPGRYNYDTCSYSQRWELYQLTAKIRKLNRLNLLQFLMGTPYMNWYFRMNGGNIGKDCCLYPAGADPFMPEPDLVTLGDRTVVDCASIVAHLNTRGNFELVPITVEQDCTLRTRSRIQQGVHMETGSMILEKSLAMTGEVIDDRTVWQGGPATMWFRYPDKDVDYQPPVKETEMSRIPSGSADDAALL
jgi:acyl-coenzyme A synthetase/AMP-(fatty) acid ligase/carbonic anhydrase/acetyltransferase-like protein (isoleucine patch superfamily)/acyl carrier protein